MADRPQVADHYGAQYRAFADDVYAEFRRAAFGQDVGQNSWLTVDELERVGVQLQLGSSSRLLDVGCGSGFFDVVARLALERRLGRFA